MAGRAGSGGDAGRDIDVVMSRGTPSRCMAELLFDSSARAMWLKKAEFEDGPK